MIPLSYRPSLEILGLVSELDEFKGAWRLLSHISPDRLAALRHVATVESVGSSTRIEGVTLTDSQVEAFLAGLDTQSLQSRDEEEVAGYAFVMEIISAHWDEIPLTENYVEQLHAMLLQYSGKDQRHRGEYKKLPNQVEAFDAEGRSLGIVFKTATPFETPMRMQELVVWTSENLREGSMHPLLVIAGFVVVFLAIHPFQDGNGRLSRALTTLLLLQSGYAYVLFSSLESVIEGSKEGYYLALRRTQGSLEGESPDWDSWLLFFLRAMQRQKARLEVKLNREQSLTNALPALSAEILQLARERGRIKISEIATLTGEKRSTIKWRLSQLVTAGALDRHGAGPSTWYTATHLGLR